MEMSKWLILIKISNSREIDDELMLNGVGGLFIYYKRTI